MKCYDCDFENPEKSKFCGKCGKALAQEWTYGTQEWAHGAQKEMIRSYYKKFLIPVISVLGVLLMANWIITPNLPGVIADIPRTLVPTPAPMPSSPAPMVTKTVEPSTPIPTSQPLASTPSAIPTKATPASKTVILEPVKEESGNMWSGSSFPISVGDDQFDGSYQTFLSYNIKSIPTNTTITEAILDLSAHSRLGDPFYSGLGCMGAYEQDFGAVDRTDFFFGKPSNSLSKWCTYEELSEPYSSQELISALQSKLGKSRFQIRVQFDKSTDGNKQEDYINFYSYKLRLTYNVP